jgi:hypothetical protein
MVHARAYAARSKPRLCSKRINPGAVSVGRFCTVDGTAPPPESTLGHIAPAPVAQRSQNGAQALAALGQLVFEPWRVFAVQTTGDESLTFHGFKARGERVRRHASQRFLQVLETPRPLQQQIAQDEDGPPLADQVERFRDRTVLIIGLWHTLKLAG